MDTLKKISLVLFIFPAITLVYDLVDGWFVHAKFELQTLNSWIKKVGINSDYVLPVKHVIAAVSSSAAADKVFNTPAPFVLIVPPLFLYLLYRVIFLISGGKAGGYKSRH
jgi:hypothetical protein